MSVNPAENIEQAQPSDKELNFRKQEEMFKRQLEQERSAREQERQARLAAEEKIAMLARQALGKQEQEDDEESDDEPYVDHKKLNKKFSKFERQLENKIEEKAAQKAKKIFEEYQQEQWLRQNPDYEEVMNHAQSLYDADNEFGETILKMPDNFERKKLVYKAIKVAGLHKAKEAKPSIQDKVDQNRRTPYYQPSGVASPASGHITLGREVSPQEGQQAYKKLVELKSRLRI